MNIMKKQEIFRRLDSIEKRTKDLEKEAKSLRALIEPSKPVKKSSTKKTETKNNNKNN
jgi:tetrahydromethanopterin S-methyltransferase subunit B